MGKTKCKKKISLDSLRQFYGYGNPKGDIWFLGMEEALPDQYQDNLQRRMCFKTPFEDLRQAHVCKLEIRKHHENNRKCQRTWWGMCRIMLAYEGRNAEREDVREYQAQSLGRTDGNTLLLELLPIPKPNANCWPDEYSSIFGYETLAEYRREEMPDRKRYIRKLIKKHKPKAIIAYGSTFWEHYRDIFNEVQFAGDNFVEKGEYNSTLIFLTHHFTSIGMNGRYQCIAESIRKHAKTPLQK